MSDMEAINNIKNYLLHLESFDDVDTFSKLQEEIRKLIQQPGISIGITPFFFINDRLVFSAIHSVNSIFLKNLSSPEEKEIASEGLKNYFDKNPTPLILPEVSEDALLSYSFISHLRQQGWKGMMFCPLRNHNNLVGVLEIVSAEPGNIHEGILDKIDIAVPLFELAVNKSWLRLVAKIDKVIKEQFTAIQPSVEWKFVEGAVNYLLKSEQDEDAKVDPILFDNVYPLYGSIDIRNSSTERNKAIQMDMLKQLDMASAIINKSGKADSYPLLKEVNYKIKKYRHSVSNIILSEDEISINQFFKKEVVELFNHLKEVIPELEEDINKYFVAVNSSVEMVYHHRKDFDESIMTINKTLARFIDQEQKAAQSIYPHYFERFVTDGLDFNMYVGQSIAPRVPFSYFFLRNIKIWQLTTLAKAAKLAHQMKDNLPVSLQTTQLILAHHYPISISFRDMERKFDVDGAYNIRYEIIKKRIDKVHIKDTNERLTQPGKIALVYSQPDEANEYIEYIDYLVNEGLLTGELEKVELEELQGVSGLKALRIDINVGDEQKKNSELKSETHKR